MTRSSCRRADSLRRSHPEKRESGRGDAVKAIPILMPLKGAAGGRSWPDSESTVAGRGGGFLGRICRAGTRPPGQPLPSGDIMVGATSIRVQPFRQEAIW
jgi:hypothetical protein